MNPNHLADFILLDCQVDASGDRVVAVLTVTTDEDHAQGKDSTITLRMLPEEADLMAKFLADAANAASVGTSTTDPA